MLEAAWIPDAATVAEANVSGLMASRGLGDYARLHAWSVEDRAGFWAEVVEQLGIVFAVAPRRILGSEDPEHPRWLDGARLNIVASCLRHEPTRPAVIHRRGGINHVVTYGALRSMVMEFVAGLAAAGHRPGERVAIAMPMTLESIVAYLGVVWAGGVVVSIADSFAPDEIATRLRITDTWFVVTQDRVLRAGRSLPMFEKVVAAGARRTVVVPTGGSVELGDGDVVWREFLGGDGDAEAVAGGPDESTNILFSSGTTGEPKAIPWTQLTPIKAAMDGRFHQDIHAGDVVAWPTNLGWMMGPWLVYASLVNGAAIALHDDAPHGGDFGRFVAEAGVTILGVVPSLVAAWRSTGCMEGLDWSRIRLFSSTGEASNPSDMAYLMGLAGGRPVIEYCGGTEIGGGYLTGTVVQPAVPGSFTTPALGIDLRILDEEGRRAASGEVFLVAPSIGLSQRLLNADHHEVYYAGTPKIEGLTLRRHGDHIEQLDGGYFRVVGRVDDAMNLGGIKVAAADIERAVAGVEGVAETAAVAIAPRDGGPGRLVVFAVPVAGHHVDVESWRSAMQERIGTRLNPLFKVHRVVAIDALPRTASAKVMRRRLRDDHANL
jgi:acetyl-CoA synthetase